MFLLGNQQLSLKGFYSYISYLIDHMPASLKASMQIILVLCLLSFVSKTSAYQQQKPQPIITNELNDLLLSTEDIQKGASITPAIMSTFKGFAQQAYIFYGPSYYNNIKFIRDKMNTDFPGDWLITILNSTDMSPATPDVTFGVSAYSFNGSWWMYWKGANHYQPTMAYYFSRFGSQEFNSSIPSLCYTYNNGSSYPTDTFRNIVSAVESDSESYMIEADSIQRFLKQYSPSGFPNVLATKRLVYFFSCQWGVKDANYMQTSQKNNTILSFPRI